MGENMKHHESSSTQSYANMSMQIKWSLTFVLYIINIMVTLEIIFPMGIWSIGCSPCDKPIFHQHFFFLITKPLFSK